MKKITAILTAAFMFTALIAGSVTAAEDDVTGTWYLQSMVQDGIEVDALMAALGSIIVWFLIKFSRKRDIKRWGGALLLVVYAIYLTYRLMNC